MAFQIHEQYIDSDSGFHVIRLRDGKKEHIVQIAVGHDACPACGHLTPKDNLGELDPKAMVAEVNEALNASQSAMMNYAAKHQLKVK